MAVTIIINSNSWITLAEANNYIEAIPNSSSWTALTDTVKKQYIITAYRKIIYSSELSISTVTQRIKDAQAQFAYWLSKYMNEWEKRQALYASGVRSFDLPGWAERLEKATLPYEIQNMLADNLSGGVHFGNVSRDLD